MSATQKFLFNSVFDTEPDAESAAATDAPAPARYTDADLAAAREQGFAAGAAEAAAEARASIEQATADSLATIAQRLEAASDLQTEIGERNLREVAGTAIAVLRKLHPALMQRHGWIEVEALLRQTLEPLRDEPRAVLRVTDDLLDPLRERLDEMVRAAGFEGRLVLLADETIAPGDCRIEWADGGVERDSAAVWRDIEAAWQRNLSATPDAVAAACQPDPEPDPNRDSQE